MPHASRPHMPGYGIQGPGEGSGLLSWAWADQRLTAARYYWVTSLWPDGRPHSMPVWAPGTGRSSGSAAPAARARRATSRPTRAASSRPRMPTSPVVIEGSAELERERDVIERVAELLNAKYGGITAEFLAANATIRVRPRWAFGIEHDDFTGSATRWSFDERVPIARAAHGRATAGTRWWRTAGHVSRESTIMDVTIIGTSLMARRIGGPCARRTVAT